MRHVRGFTLVELLVVFAIMALVIGVVPVAMERMREGAQYREVVRTVNGQLKTARAQAIASGKGVYFVVDPNQRQFGLLGAAPLTALPQPLQMRAVVASTDSVQRTGRLSILFMPTGGASGGSIEILRAAGAGTRLRVDWLTGRVTSEALLP